MRVKTIGKNHAIITTENGEYLTSYDSVIVQKKAGNITLDERYWDYSVTTGKYRNLFLGESIKETRKKIDQGIYTLDDLNTSKDVI